MWECKRCYTKRENPLFSLRKTGLCGKCQNPKYNDLPKFTLNATHIAYCENCEVVDELRSVSSESQIRCVACDNLMKVRVFR